MHLCHLRRSLGRVPISGATPWLIRLAVIAFAVALLTLPIVWSVRFSAQTGWWWERGFTVHNAERRTGLERDELDRAGAELRAYFLSDEEFVDIRVRAPSGAVEPLFSEREVLHLVDVKRLLTRTYDASWAALGFIIVFIAAIAIRERQNAPRALARASLVSGGIAAGTIFVVGVIAVTGFDEAFRQFHLLLFTNDLWKLSSRDRLIQMFPQGFFVETAMLIGVTTIAVAGGTAAWGWWFLRRGDRAEPALTIETLEESGID